MKLVLALVVAACGSPQNPAPKPVQNTAPVDQQAAATLRERCVRLFDHLIDLELAQAGIAPTHEHQDAVAAQKASVREAKLEQFVATCIDKTPPARIECALAAPDLDAVSRCDQP